jgi:peroxiredoxin
MPPRKLALWIGSLTLLSSTLISAHPAPRKSPELTVSEPSGKQTSLSSLKGKVVVIEFLFMNSEHCLRVAKTLNSLQGEMGRRGLQSVGVVFGPHADEQHVVYTVDYLKLTYPLGFTTSAKVDSFLGRAGNEILSIPQVVVIDRAGTIRASSGRRPGDANLENEAYLRNLIDSLLKEEVPTTPIKRRVVPVPVPGR